jgi:hypothetical protein
LWIGRSAVTDTAAAYVPPWNLPRFGEFDRDVPGGAHNARSAV